VKIDIPRILLELRAEVVEAKTREGSNRWERLAFRAWAWLMRRPKLYQAFGLIASGLAPATETDSSGPHWIRSLPALLNVGPIKAWTSVRDLPPPPEQNFRAMWRERVGARRNSAGNPARNK
jgi:L-lactate dehydrogenase complex protein LldF